MDCDECVSSFADSGGCSCIENPTCDVSSLIPEGCFSCEKDKAIKYCDSQKGARNIESK